jgi:hypothetical protein
MASFLGGDPVPAMAWLEKKQTDKDLIRPGHLYRKVVAPMAVSGVVFLRSTGLSALIEFLEVTFALKHIITPTQTIIDFKDAKKYFGNDNAFLYILGVVYAAAMGLAKKLHLLL